MRSILSFPRDTCQMIISGTDTFRLGHRKVLSKKGDSLFCNYGGNRANIEKGMREVWKADDGFLFAQPDQSGAEALIVAYLCKPGKYRALFENGIKPHTYLALKRFPNVWKKYFPAADVDECMNAPIQELNKVKSWKAISAMIKDSDNWSSSQRYYHIAKKVIHASSYGMKANTFRNNVIKESGGTIVISIQEANRLLLGLHMEFPEIQDWHIRTFTTLKKKGQLRNLFDFPYNISTEVRDNDYKDFIAWIPQSTVACITRNAAIKFQDYVEENNIHWHFLADTHDSYLSEAPGTITADGVDIAGEILECGKIMKSFLEVELVSPLDGVKFRMKSECSIGANWAPRKEKYKDGKLVEVINPLGLREVKLV